MLEIFNIASWSVIKKAMNNQRGSIIIYSLLILLSIVTISVALIRIISPKFQILREASYSMIALYAADSGMEWCLFSNRTNPASSIPSKLQQLNTIPGVVMGYYDFDGAGVSACPYNAELNFRTVGTYRGISRSLGIQ
ncbi:MAG: hypothetical protein A2817_03595 [Candidatus Yanofskybacteria bacterium RIFCSPHIGHO2_01_FULL_39_8b]|uniref:Type 4 fimbrial biogenesis protein PilX N-terminal domain-containing protein n=1 Tax=Candidatus Yanofskybacteria bacterium RIFCSPHIGHO2_01_FULL_39_8b TaxID=1802659 RepID=A0A1F8EBF0_9BACT|nr:MAG: hypothetical protein A2817_03595 [Candidatus Yanofskybacteria bacterium RIFCSPHIGHO2_01_FULL_39_8b]